MTLGLACRRLLLGSQVCLGIAPVPSRCRRDDPARPPPPIESHASWRWPSLPARRQGRRRESGRRQSRRRQSRRRPQNRRHQRCRRFCQWHGLRSWRLQERPCSWHRHCAPGSASAPIEAAWTRPVALPLRRWIFACALLQVHSGHVLFIPRKRKTCDLLSPSSPLLNPPLSFHQQCGEAASQATCFASRSCNSLYRNEPRTIAIRACCFEAPPLDFLFSFVFF